ncbi:Metallo-dependent phosphatase-like protein [Mycena alexandri]|uniref:Metallo-dependent phosphatase-like protein n=1 Tax=Mycena alexandri TaxID=1745969 RepID=A0AAD6WPW4_9AGAR|nr:Metallo-dependent phosphatase-like protein [Mycena alexandri]
MPTIALPHRTSITSRSSVVQLEYPPDTGPLPKPGAQMNGDDVPPRQWTRFVLLSDTHGRTCNVPDGDVLLHTGDLTDRGTLKELEKTMEWLCGLPHRVKIVIAGNHDSNIHREWYEANWKELFIHRSNDAPESVEAVLELLGGSRATAANIVYLQDELYKFKARDEGKEWSVYGSPWTPYWGDWAFGYEKEDGPDVVAKFPEADILCTHGPPLNVFDQTINKDLAGCAALAAELPRLKPKLHVFGHIHEARGAYVHRWEQDSDHLGAQNAIQLGVERADGKTAVTPRATDHMETDDSYRDDGAGTAGEGAKETIFVNAANMPMGPNARRMGVRLKMGDQPFQPIVVDLLE